MEAGVFQTGVRDATNLMLAGMDSHNAATRVKRFAKPAERSACPTEMGAFCAGRLITDRKRGRDRNAVPNYAALLLEAGYE